MSMQSASIEGTRILSAQPLYASQIVKFYNKVGGETDYLSFGQDEYPLSAEEMADTIEGMKDSHGNCMLLMMDGEEIVGIGTIESSSKSRFRHVGTLGIVISQSHAGKGLGRMLMNALIDWSKDNGQTKKVSLVTRADNEHAIALYVSLGFEREGLFRKDFYDGGTYYDSLSMALFL
ncbi:GNAT family protein [Sporosarcina jeotgali]|uniref:GNAT family protein n=1 Tax=Sporosarcina jeotgali TaxID=3020056 RepID=A0ABZ0KWR4_9BACL|nr:GNAT family protein [Sporosarcina sp. B2O-1]WOV83876.1 GNAT family protein [Sporosarcina sp. B2O-1]